MLEYIKPGDIKIEVRERKDFGDLESLTASIKEKGILQPITVDSNMKLLAGERRLRAAMILNLETIPALVRPAGDRLSEFEIELAENVHRKDFTWQERVRLEKKIYDMQNTLRGAAEIAGVSKSALHRHIQLAEAMDVVPEIGAFTSEADAWKRLNKMQEGMILEELKKRAVSSATDVAGDHDSDAPVAPREPGQKITLEQYTVRAHNNYKMGSCIDGMIELVERIEDRKTTGFDFAEVDPPYGIDLAALRMVNTEAAQADIDSYSEVPTEAYPQFLDNVMDLTYRSLGYNAFCIWWFGADHFAITRDTLQKVGFTLSAVPGIWYKGDQGQTMSPNVNLANCYEMFWVCRKGNPVIAKPGRSNVFHFPPIPAQNKSHPTERPIELILELLSTFTVPLHRVLVPFLGSGNTIRASYIHRNPVIGWDVDKQYKGSFIMNVQKDYDNGKYPLE